MLFEYVAPGLREIRRARMDLGAVGLHHDAPVRLVVVADAHHVDRALDPHAKARAEPHWLAPVSVVKNGREVLRYYDEDYADRSRATAVLSPTRRRYANEGCGWSLYSPKLRTGIGYAGSGYAG
jgi:hypothetical protein